MIELREVFKSRRLLTECPMWLVSKLFHALVGQKWKHFRTSEQKT
jgi:hypothetical protein